MRAMIVTVNPELRPKAFNDLSEVGRECGRKRITPISRLDRFWMRRVMRHHHRWPSKRLPENAGDVGQVPPMHR